MFSYGNISKVGGLIKIEGRKFVLTKICKIRLDTKTKVEERKLLGEGGGPKDRGTKVEEIRYTKRMAIFPNHPKPMERMKRQYILYGLSFIDSTSEQSSITN